MNLTRLGQAAALARDWIAPGDALAQWTHFVTSACNARCSHCFYPINVRSDELTLDEIDRLARTLPPIRLLLISGGEPFIRRDLPEVIRIYFERCRFFNVSVPTNGFNARLITDEVEKICAISSSVNLGISVSIDGFSDFHDSVRRLPGLYDRAIETLESLLELAGHTPNLTVGVTTVFMRDNQTQIRQFCDFIYERYRPMHHSLGFIRGDAYDPALKEGLDVDLYLRVSESIDRRYPTGEGRAGWRGARTRARREINRRRFEYIGRQTRGGSFEQFCLAGEREYVMSETGDVYPCELIGQSLGNVRSVGYDFSAIRRSETARELVDRKKETLCHCTHECNTRTMLLFDRANAAAVVGAMAGLEMRRPGTHAQQDTP